MKKRFFAFMLALLMLSLTACGSSAKATNAPMAAESAMDAYADYDYSYERAEEAAAMKEQPASNGSTLPAGRKWIITGNMETETDDLDAALSAIREKITALGGYIENQNSYNGSTYNGRRYRNSNLTVRIPADRLDAFTDAVQGCVNVVSSSRDAQDVTLTYVDTESRIAALRTEQSRLMELLAQADNMSDLLEIEARLTDVNYELERYSSKLRTLDNQIDYATISLFISEVKEYTPVEEPGFFQRIRQGFTSNLQDLWETLQDLAVFVITNIPALILWGLVIFGVVKLAKKHPIRRRSRKAADQEQAE